MDAALAIAEVLEIPADQFLRHLRTPLPRPQPAPLSGWPRHETVVSILALCDGFSLFGPHDPFHIFGKRDYEELGELINTNANQLGLLPIFGRCPHLTSIEVASGAVVSTDWEFFCRPEHGWLERIAPSFSEYIRTVMVVREAHGGSDDEWPSDWWHPYAMYGDRFDLESK